MRQVPCSGARRPVLDDVGEKELLESRRLGSEKRWRRWKSVDNGMGESAGAKVVAHLTQLRCAHKDRVVTSVRMTNLAGHLLTGGGRAWLPGVDFRNVA